MHADTPTVINGTHTVGDKTLCYVDGEVIVPSGYSLNDLMRKIGRTRKLGLWANHRILPDLVIANWWVWSLQPQLDH